MTRTINNSGGPWPNKLQGPNGRGSADFAVMCHRPAAAMACYSYYNIYIVMVGIVGQRSC